jgi:hypothetical protein
MSPGKPGIDPRPAGNIPAGDRERSLDPLILGPVGNIPGRREYSRPDREYPRPAGISPGPSGISPAGGDIPGPHWEYPRPAGISPARSVISRAGGEYPRPPLGISPAGGNIPGPAHREYPRPREYSRPIENIPGRRGYSPAHREYPRPAGNIPVPLAGVSPAARPLARCMCCDRGTRSHVTN